MGRGLLVLTNSLIVSESPPRGPVRPGEVRPPGGNDVVDLRQAGAPASHLPGEVGQGGHREGGEDGGADWEQGGGGGQSEVSPD